MSTTRSRSRPGPATDPRRARALVLVGHGSTRRAAPNRLLGRHAETIARRGLFPKVCVAALHGEPGPETALRRLGGDPAWIVPLFMSDGRYTRRRIPELFGVDGTASGCGLSVLPPLGLHPGIAEIATDRALDWARDEGVPPASVTLVLVGHGSADDPASHDATDLQASRVRETGIFGAVKTAFLQQAPNFTQVVRSVGGPLVAVGLFAADGVHGAEDVPHLIAESGARGAVYLGAIGGDPRIPDVIIDLVGIQA